MTDNEKILRIEINNSIDKIVQGVVHPHIEREKLAEKLVKLFAIPVVTQQSELLMACLNKLNELGYNLDFEYDEETCNEVVKAINCG